MEFKLGRKIPARQKYNGGYFFVQLQDGDIVAVPSLDAYYDAALATVPLPVSVDYTAKCMSAIKRVYRNDARGCCVISSAWHEIGLWTGNDTGTPVECTDEEIDRDYRLCGPGDNGCNITRILEYTKTKGLVTGGVAHKIDGYVSVDNTNKELVKVAISIFGSLKLGIDLPGSWRDSADNATWDMTNSRTVGGHDVPTGGYSEAGVTILTWGGLRTITWTAFTSSRYVTECYLPLSPDWYGRDNLAPNGIDAFTLKANLDAIANGTVPPFGPPPTIPLDWLI